MRVSLFSTAVLLVILIGAGGSVLACSCIPAPEPESFKRADLVFEGEVIRLVPDEQYPERIVGYTFRVDKMLKGEDVAEVTFYRTSNCDAIFTLGAVYRVYAYRHQGKLKSSQCSGNKFLRRKKAQHSS